MAFRKYQILPDKGSISHEQAKAHAEAEYDNFNKKQKIESDFDRAVKKLTAKAQKKDKKNNG